MKKPLHDEANESMIDISVITVVPEAFILEVIAPERIIVINLDRRPDRWTALQSAWHSSIAERLTRFSATDGLLLPPHRVEECRSRKDQPFEQSAGILGCRDSWMRAVENYGPGLYFEDDARPCQSWPYGLPPEDAEFVLLGGDLWPKSPAPGWSPVRQQIAGAQAVWIRTQRAADSLLKTW